MKEYLKKLNLISISRLLFSDTQRKILKECKIANSEDNYQWFIRNLGFPIVIITLPLFLHLVFPTDVKDYKTLIFNGSISLIGINILFGMSTYLIKVNRLEKEGIKDLQDQQENFPGEKVKDKLNQDVISLRERLDNYKNILVFIGGVFYVVQALYGKYNSDILFYVFLFSTILVLFLSIQIGRYMFIIKDDFFEKTFYGEVNDTVMQARDRWARKY